MTVRLHELKPEAVAAHYPPAATTVICEQISQFGPFKDNFPSTECYFAPSQEGHTLLHLAIKLRVDTSRAGPAAGPGPADVVIDLTYPSQFPVQQLIAQVEAPQQNGPRRLRIRQDSLVMSREGIVRLVSLQTLRGTPWPFPLIDVLLALIEHFSNEFPYVAEGAVSPASQPPLGHGAPPANALMNSALDPLRSKRVQEAAESVVTELHTRAASYLQMREKSLYYLQSLSENNRDLTQAREVLAKHKQELESYLPRAGDVEALIKKLESVPNTVEEHSRCLVAQTEMQENALGLMAEIHASEDVLALLEEGLKNDYFDVDEYVKCVTDVGREQFTARFLCQRLFKELNQSQPSAAGSPVSSGSGQNGGSGDPAPPPVPQRISKVEALLLEFPTADPGIVRDVMIQVNNDIVSARRQLRAMFPADG